MHFIPEYERAAANDTSILVSKHGVVVSWSVSCEMRVEGPKRLDAASALDQYQRRRPATVLLTYCTQRPYVCPCRNSKHFGEIGLITIRKLAYRCLILKTYRIVIVLDPRFELYISECRF